MQYKLSRISTQNFTCYLFSNRYLSTWKFQCKHFHINFRLKWTQKCCQNFWQYFIILITSHLSIWSFWSNVWIYTTLIHKIYFKGFGKNMYMYMFWIVVVSTWNSLLMLFIQPLSWRRGDRDTERLLTIFSEVMLAVFLDVENKVEILKVEIGKIWR